MRVEKFKMKISDLILTLTCIIHDEFVNQKMSPDLAKKINKRIQDIIKKSDINQNLDLVVTTSKLQFHPNNLFSYLFLNNIVIDLSNQLEVIYSGRKYVFIDCNKYFNYAIQGYLKTQDFECFDVRLSRIISYDVEYNHIKNEYCLQIPELQMYAFNRYEYQAKQELVEEIVELYKTLVQESNIGLQPSLWKTFLSNHIFDQSKKAIISRVNKKRLKKMFNYFKTKDIRITDSHQKILCNYNSFKLQSEDESFTVFLYEDEQIFQYYFDTDMKFVNVGEIQSLEYFFKIERI